MIFWSFGELSARLPALEFVRLIFLGPEIQEIMSPRDYEFGARTVRHPVTFAERSYINPLI